MAALSDHDLDDIAGGKPTPEGLARGVGQSTAVADLDKCVRFVGTVANEPRAVDRLRPQPSEMEYKAISLKEALAAHAQFGQMDKDKLKAGMGENWPQHWNEIRPGEGIFSDEVA